MDEPPLSYLYSRLRHFAANRSQACLDSVALQVAPDGTVVVISVVDTTWNAAGCYRDRRLHKDLDHSRRERVERATLRFVGGCFVALALYILFESGSTLIRHKAPERSISGFVIAVAAVIVMPLLAGAKRRVATALSSAAMRADSKQADFCTYLSAILLGGLLLNALLGWSWADPVAALVMVPIIAKEGIDGISSKVCCEDY
jgi:hypothetical protein